MLRSSGTALNTHLRMISAPMGLASRHGIVAVGTRSGVVEYRDVPQAARSLPDQPAQHDACFVPRRMMVTGDVRVHDLAYADRDLWLVATRFSCLATLDPAYSFLPRWRPPFITAVRPEDRCHLNGLAVVDARPAFVTAFSESDIKQGWREHEPTRGVVVDVASGEVIVRGLCLPHSPRWHDGKLWVLDSGRGNLCTVDLSTGELVVVKELPGFARGLAFAGDVAFVGLSRLRHQAVSASLPLLERVPNPRCGVWLVHTRSGAILGAVEFEDGVDEVYDVHALPGVRFPEFADPDGETARQTFVLPAG